MINYIEFPKERLAVKGASHEEKSFCNGRKRKCKHEQVVYAGRK